MRKGLVVVLGVIFLLVWGGASAFAKGLEVGASVQYGSLKISDHDNYDRYGSRIPMGTVSASYEVVPGVKLSAEYSLGGVTLDEPDDNDITTYGYQNLKVSGAFRILENVDLLAGWSWFSSNYVDTWYSSDWEVKNTGSGFKVGFAASVPVTNSISASVRYAFLPYVYSETFTGYSEYPTTASVDEEPTENYVGIGHELEAKLNLSFRGGLAVQVGYRTEVYNGASDCCIDYVHDRAGFSGLFAGVTYSF
ncbi:MAG: hypothetical protein NUW23_08360 [Firmicutes bacterium]|nr:hypothetical protein [Bacillota bacterium]